MTNIGVLTFLWLLFEKRYRGFICFIIPFLCFAAAQLAINRFVMGSITSFTHLNATSCFVRLSRPDEGFLLKRIDVLTNKTHGFLPFAPFLIYGLVAMFRYAGRRNTGLVSLLNIGFFLLIWSNGWMGVGYQYAVRYFLPMIPLLSVPTQQ